MPNVIRKIEYARYEYDIPLAENKYVSGIDNRRKIMDDIIDMFLWILGLPIAYILLLKTTLIPYKTAATEIIGINSDAAKYSDPENNRINLSENALKNIRTGIEINNPYFRTKLMKYTWVAFDPLRVDSWDVIGNSALLMILNTMISTLDKINAIEKIPVTSGDFIMLRIVICPFVIKIVLIVTTNDGIAYSNKIFFLSIFLTERSNLGNNRNLSSKTKRVPRPNPRIGPKNLNPNIISTMDSVSFAVLDIKSVKNKPPIFWYPVKMLKNICDREAETMIIDKK